LAAEIKKQKGIDVQLVKGKNGVFDVFKDESLVFSKYEQNRFPEIDDLLDKL
jgi:selenoprotein W-related protein